jgi:hypothetical protein
LFNTSLPFSARAWASSTLTDVVHVTNKITKTLTVSARHKTFAGVTADLFSHTHRHLIDQPVTVIVIPVTKLRTDRRCATVQEHPFNTAATPDVTLNATLFISVLINLTIFVIVTSVADLFTRFVVRDTIIIDDATLEAHRGARVTARCDTFAIAHLVDQSITVIVLAVTFIRRDLTASTNT